MRHRLILLVSTLGLTLGGATLPLTAAHADVAPTPVFTSTIVNLDSSTPGHVTGTIVTDAKELQVFAANADNDYYVDSVFVKDVSGSYSFDLETWGLDAGQIQFWACGTGWTQCSLTKGAYLFTATDLAPTSVTWPDDVTIGEEPYAVSAVDAPSAGGHLWVSPATRAGDQWGSPGMPAGSQPLATDGTTRQVDPPTDGVTTLNLLRCNRDSAPTACRPTGLSRTISVDRDIRIQSVQPATQYASASASFTLNLEAGESDQPEHTGPIDLSWEVIGPQMRIAARGQATGLVLTGHSVTVSIDTSSLPADGYYVRWTVAATNDAYGRVATGNQEFGSFIVDHMAPPVPTLTASATSVYPVQDRYRDFVTFHASPGYVDGTSRMEIWNSTGSTRLQSLAWDYQAEADQYFSYTWRGRYADGSPYPAGSYRTRIVHTDQAGNVAAAWGPTIAVVRKHLSARDWTRTVTAQGSLAVGHAGGCSRLRSPSGHGWTGSLGLLSRYYCSTSGAPSLVKISHQVTAPAATRYSDVSLAVYGGSARNRATDSLSVSTGHDGQWYRTEASSKVGWHTGVGTMQVGPGRLLTWESWVTGGRRYDVGSYRLHMRYWVLVAD